MNKGLTLPELMITMAIVSILFMIGGLSFGNMQSESQLDLYAQEVKDDMLRAQGRTLNNIPAGVYFESQRFVYFEGTAYVEGALGNEEEVLSSGTSITAINFPSHILQYVAVTGYVKNYQAPSNVVITETQTGKTRTINVNELGVVNIL